MATLAFDVYGTLINTYGMIDLLQRYIGEERALPFAMQWRDKQLEYSFRRSMTNCYEPFYTCTSNALDWSGRPTHTIQSLSELEALF